jgi:hypothetical protein
MFEGEEFQEDILVINVEIYIVFGYCAKERGRKGSRISS